MNINDFDRAFSYLLSVEGVYSNDPRDPGGATKYGISSKAYPSEDIKNLDATKARLIFQRDYWNKLNCDGIPYPLNIYLFDSAVNQGITSAIKTLQKVLGVTVDGIQGSETMGAVGLSTPTHATMFLVERALTYSSLAGFNTYGRGWIKRLFILARTFP